jgi:hypothetical protein
LSDYVRLYIQQNLQQGEASLDQMNRATKQTQAMTTTVGKNAVDIREQEVANEMALKRFEYGNYANQKNVISFLERYESALRRSKTAADEAAVAQERFDAKAAANLSDKLLAAGGDPRSQSRAQFENNIIDFRRSFKGSSKDADEIEADKRRSFANQELMPQKQAERDFTIRKTSLEAQARLVGLTTDEYQVQNAILQKQIELMRQGYNVADDFYQAEVQRTEKIERDTITQTHKLAAARSLFKTLNDGVASFEGLFKNAFDTTFTYGAKRGADVLGKGLGDIIKKISADMIYSIAVRPFEALAQQMASKLGMFLVSFITPAASGATSNTSGAPMLGPGMRNAANGAYFDGMHRFAMGGAFTNKIVNQPTLFAFAQGAGLMGEAGPEAIMPLKRDASGRLGVAAGGGEGGTQVVINDMRTAPNSQRVQASESRGPDGKRILSIMIRDEMRKQFRSGDMDREMSGNYGASRTLARK